MRFLPVACALFISGCATYPTELLISQTRALQKAEDTVKSVRDNVTQEYVEPGIAADKATLRGAAQKDLEEYAKRYSAGELDGQTFMALTINLNERLKEIESQKEEDRRAILGDLEAAESLIKGSSENLELAVKKINP